MIKKILITLLMSFMVIFMILYSLYEDPLKFINFINITFIVGVTEFFIGIIATTNITDVFIGFGYNFKKLFSNRYKHMAYIDYYNERKDKKAKATGFPILFVGGLLTAISTIISYTM